MTREEIIDAVQRVARERNSSILRFRDFHAATRISQRTMFGHFDSWSEACNAAGISCGPTAGANLIRNETISPQACIAELRRVALLLDKKSMSREEYAKHSNISWETVFRRFGGWPKALAAASLDPNPNVFPSLVPIERLIQDFLKITVEMRKVPTLHQLARRSQFGIYLFSGKQGGYPTFKKKAIANILSNERDLAPDIHEILRKELERIETTAQKSQSPIRPHQHGRILGFRAFAHKPTYEMEVVSMFTLIAEELGFEIICQRGEFPDCEAQRRIPGPRKRYEKCLIEFELRSSDFRHHKHPADGCDLVVCWEHDWLDCPLEVLELSKAIRSLPGWREH